MKLRSRIISSILALSFLTMSSVPALAVNDSSAQATASVFPQTISITKDAHNNVQLAGSHTMNSIQATQTNWEELYQINNSDQYVLYESNTLQLLDRLSVNTTAFDQNEFMFEEYNISEDIVNDIEEKIQQQTANSDLEVYIYVPHNNNTSQVDTLATAPSYDTKDEIVEYRNANTMYQDISSGVNTAAICDTIFDIAVGWLGSLSKTIALIGNGKSILSACGAKTVTGTTEDKAQFKLIYDKLVKYTHVYAGSGWITGCKSYKVWMDQGTIYQYYVNLKKEVYTPKNFNTVIYSASYNNAKQVALVNFMNGMKVDDPLLYKIGSLTVYF